MTPGSHRNREAFPISEIKGMGDIDWRPALRYHRGSPVYHGVMYAPGLVVPRVVASDEVHGQSLLLATRSSQVPEVNGRQLHVLSDRRAVGMEAARSASLALRMPGNGINASKLPAHRCYRLDSDFGIR
jgi:hypothetical protein